MIGLLAFVALLAIFIRGLPFITGCLMFLFMLYLLSTYSYQIFVIFVIFVLIFAICKKFGKSNKQ